MSEKVIKYGPGMSLDALSDAVGGDEALYGTLTALAAGAKTNYAIFDRGKSPKPSVRLVLGTDPPTGTTRVCTGKLWVLNAELDVVAVR